MKSAERVVLPAKAVKNVKRRFGLHEVLVPVKQVRSVDTEPFFFEIRLLLLSMRSIDIVILAWAAWDKVEFLVSEILETIIVIKT